MADDDQPITSPSQLDTDDQPITSPSQVDAADPTKLTPAEESQIEIEPSTPSLLPGAAKVGNAYKGLTPQGEQKAAATRGTIDSKVDAYSAADNARLSDQEDQLAKDTLAQKLGNDAKAKAEVDYQNGMGTAAAKLQGANEEYARQEQENAAAAKEDGAKFLQNYTQQLAAVRALTVNPVGPIAELSPGAMGGLSAAMFTQGFLAARGIKIDVAGQVDNYIQRSIHEQERRIGQAQQGVQDQMSLWQIAKQNSHDEWEARQRYRGFMLESMKASNDVLTSRFKSQLATADAGALNAQLDTQSHQAAFALRDRHEQRVLEMRKYYSDEAYKSAMIHIEEIKANAELARNSAAKGPQAQDMRLYKDPSTGKVIGYNVNKSLGADDRDKKITSAEEAIRQTDPLWKQYEVAIKKAGATGALGEGFWARTDPDAREAKTLGSKLVQMAVYADSGKAVTEEEFKRHADLVPVDNFWQAGGNERVRQNYLHHAWDKYRSVVTSNSEDPEAGRNATGTNPRGINPDEDANFKVLQKNPADAPAQDSFMGREVDAAKTVGHENAKHGDTEAKSGFFSDSKPYKPVPSSNSYYDYTAAKGTGSQDMPHELKFVDHLAMAAVSPDKFRNVASSFTGSAKGLIPDDNAALKAEGIQGLHRLAADKNPELAGYASYLLKQIEEDPDSLAGKY